MLDPYSLSFSMCSDNNAISRHALPDPEPTFICTRMSSTPIPGPPAIVLFQLSFGIRSSSGNTLQFGDGSVLSHLKSSTRSH
jgi:hypothetical protein